MCRSTKRRCPARRVATWSKRIEWWLNSFSVRWITACTSGSSARSISPSADADTSFTPSRTMLAATATAIAGSSHSQPVSGTATTAAITPIDV